MKKRWKTTMFPPLAVLRFFLNLGLAALLPVTASCAHEVDPPPNVLVIFVDDLGYNDVSFNGATEIKTPNIDQLAKEGVIFANGYVAAPTCGPSRAGLMTGRYPARFGMELNLAYAPFDPDHGLPVEETTFATYLQDSGYRTGLVGKWQLGAAPPFHPLNRGFDSFFGFLAGEHDYFRIDVTRSPLHVGWLPLSDNRGAVGFTGYLTDALTERAVDFIREESEAPFFLYLAYNAPHTPLQAPPELVKKYAHVADERRRVYLTMVDSLDYNVGQVLDALRETGQRDDTLVFFLSDNGGVYPRPSWENQTWADNSPFRGGKTSFHEGGISVTFVASWPARWPRGVTFEPMVISLDIAATALALAGVADPAQPLDGVNLDPFVRGEATGPPHDALFWRRVFPRDWSKTVYIVRAGDMKLIKATRDGDAALFDLRTDPGETRDRAGEKTDAVARLAALWNEWNRENLGYRFTDETTYKNVLHETRKRLAARSMVMPPFQIGSKKEMTDMQVTPSCSNGVVVPEPDRNPGLVADCAVLMEVKDMFVEEVHTWRFTRPLQTWEGVTIGGPPLRVRALSLAQRGLPGRLPSKLAELDRLEELRLSGNRLAGGIPPELGRLTGLRLLALSDNLLTGELPPELGALSDLEELRLRGNRLTGAIPPEWGGLPRLRLLRLADNGLVGCIPPALREVESHDLQRLGLVSCIPATP